MAATYQHPPKNDGRTYQEKWLKCVLCDDYWPQSQIVKKRGRVYCPNCYDRPLPTHYPIRHEKR